jgi:hypothetical protein
VVPAVKVVFLILAVSVVGILLWLAIVRFAPIDPAAWNVDPFEAEAPGVSGYRLGPPDAPVYDVSPEVLAEALDSAILALPRSSRIAGTPGQGPVSYLLRTKTVGYRDVLTAQVRAADGGATLAILGRTRFSVVGDRGLNERRIGRVLDNLAAALAQKGN